MKLDAGNGLGVAAVEILGEAEDCGQPSHHLAPLPSEQAEIGLPARRRRAPVVTRDQCDCLDLIGLEAAEIAVFDQIVRMAMVPFITDVDAGIVQDGCVFEPLAFLVGHAVDRPCPIEQRQRQPGDLVRVIRPVAAAFGQFDHASAAHIGITVGLRDLLAMLGDVIEDQALTKRQVAKAEVGGVELFQNRVQQNRPGHRKIGAARIHARHLEPFLEVE